MARVQPPGHSRDAAIRAMEEAAMALTDAVPAITGDDALAERERFRLTQEQEDSRQSCLQLGNPNE